MKTETLTESINDAADNHIKKVMGEFYGIDKDEVIALISIFKAGANWQNVENKRLKAINDSLLNALKEITASYMVCVKKADQSEYVINAKEAIRKAEE